MDRQASSRNNKRTGKGKKRSGQRVKASGGSRNNSLAKRKRVRSTVSTDGVSLAEKVKDAVSRDTTEAKLRAELGELRSKYKTALARLDNANTELHKIHEIGKVGIRKLPRVKRKGKRPQATVVLVCSDWHSEELIRPEDCRGLNEFDLNIADKRIKTLAAKAAMLIEHEKHLTDIRRIVVASLGDLITGHINDDCIERTQLAPLAATRWAGQRLNGVIDTMAELAPVLTVTASGNHGRSTRKPRISTENDHSYEQNLYLTMAAAERRKNVAWQVGVGYHNMVDLDGFLVRFHHGHALSGGGGVGGLTAPTNRAIAKWNIAKAVDLDVFGHFHQFIHVPYRFVCNGCLCGHNAYADRIKAEFQPPSQSLIVIDHNHQRVTKVLPVFV